MKRRLLYSLVAFYLLSVFCTSHTRLSQVTKPVPVIPAGVDRKVALAADSIASTFMVPESQRDEANAIITAAGSLVELSNSIWAFYEMFQDTALQFDQLDTLNLRQSIDSAFVALKSDPEKLKAIKKMRKQYGSLDNRVIKQLSLALLERVHLNLERAEVLDPLNFAALGDNIRALGKIAAITADDKIYLNLRQKLNYYTQIQKGDPVLFYSLGDINFQLKEYQKAFENYRQAQLVEERSAVFKILNPDTILTYKHQIPFDTVKIVVYLKKQAMAKTKLYDDQTALSLLQLARSYTRDEAEKDEIKNVIDWIEWDGGNIRASELKDSLVTVERDNKAGAKNGFLILLSLLRTKKAADEINWKIARIDFEFLNLKSDAAARLLPVIKTTVVDSLGTPTDSTYEKYMNDFGAICFNIGEEFYNQKEYKKSYAYFMQSAVINWSERGVCYLYLAKLSESNPTETIDKCLSALQYPLTKEEQYQAYQLLIQSHVRLGEFDQARKYFNIAQKEKPMIL